MKTKNKTIQSKGLALKDYFESLDLYNWWEQFSGSYAENGMHKYITAWAFIKAKTKDVTKRKFLWWILGPKAETPKNPEFDKFPQFDWERKRREQFWLSNEKIEQIKSHAANRASSIDEVRAIGAFNLDDMGRIKTLCDQLDSEFGGRLQLPNLSAKENDLRLNNYLSLRTKLQDMLHNAQSMFARTRSVDMQAIAQMLQVTGATILGTVQGTNQLTPEQQSRVDAFGSLQEMLLKKANDWEIELPDRDMAKMVKAGAKPVSIDRKKAN